MRSGDFLLVVVETASDERGVERLPNESKGNKKIGKRKQAEWPRTMGKSGEEPDEV